MLDHKDNKDRLGHRVPLDLQDPQAHLVPRVLLALKDSWVQKDQQEIQDPQESKVYLDQIVLVNVEHQVMLVHQVRLDHLDQLVQMDRVAASEILGVLVSLVLQVMLQCKTYLTSLDFNGF